MSDLTPQSEVPTPTTDKITQAARETIYLCNFRVSVDGEWLCLRELNDISLTPEPEPAHEGRRRGRHADRAFVCPSRTCLIGGKTPHRLHEASGRRSTVI